MRSVWLKFCFWCIVTRSSWLFYICLVAMAGPFWGMVVWRGSRLLIRSVLTLTLTLLHFDTTPALLLALTWTRQNFLRGKVLIVVRRKRTPSLFRSLSEQMNWIDDSFLLLKNWNKIHFIQQIIFIQRIRTSSVHGWAGSPLATKTKSAIFKETRKRK